MTHCIDVCCTWLSICSQSRVRYTYTAVQCMQAVVWLCRQESQPGLSNGCITFCCDSSAGRVLVLGQRRNRQQLVPCHVPVVPRRSSSRPQNRLAAHNTTCSRLTGSVIPQLQRSPHCWAHCCLHDWLHYSAVSGADVLGFAPYQAWELGGGGLESSAMGRLLECHVLVSLMQCLVLTTVVEHAAMPCADIIW